MFQTIGGGTIAWATGTGITFRRNTTIAANGGCVTAWIRFTNVTGGTEAVTVYQG
jgi:hypothetical protein